MVNLVGPALAVGGGYAVNQIGGPWSAMTAWSVVALAAQTGANVLVSRLDRVRPMPWLNVRRRLPQAAEIPLAWWGVHPGRILGSDERAMWTRSWPQLWMTRGAG